jgi:membrane-bound serine protease (ClpP class)
MKKKVVLFGLLIILFITLFTNTVFAALSPRVFVIPVESTIDLGLASFIDRSYKEAEALAVDLVLLEIDTPGGRVDAAQEIKKTITNSPLSTAALVKGGAISAGAYITLACPKIAMVPGSTIGDAEPRIGDERADEKFVSYWASEMGATAERNGRDRTIAMAMADRDLEIPGLVEKGKLLTLTYQQALEYRFTDYVVQDQAEFLEILNLSGAEVLEAQLSTAEKITRIVTNPYISTLLLTLGIAGILIEILTVGWGIAGFVGLASLALYFGGHILAGFTGWEAILLFLLGLILLCVEIFMPGFGIFGFGGIASISLSIILSAPSWEAGIISLVLAILGTIILIILSLKLLTKRKFWDRLVLGTKYKKEEGYIPQGEDLSIHLGKRGEAITILRPAGTVMLDDGTRLDVVTDGSFIQKGERIEIIKVEGIRLIVRAIKED